MSEKTTENLDLSMPVQFLKGVGPARAENFAQLGVKTVGDLLEYFPRDWSFIPEPVKINQLRPNQQAAIIGLVESTDYIEFRRNPMFEAMLSDDSGICRAVWFHGGYLRGKIEPGMVILATGKVKLYKHQLQLSNPKFVVLDEQHHSLEYRFFRCHLTSPFGCNPLINNNL